MSWQPVPQAYGGASMCGWAITLAPWMLSSGTPTIEIFSKGGWQRGPVPDGYEEM